MPSYTVSVAAASAGVGVDLFDGEVWSRTPQNRVITGLACKGSAAAGDTRVEPMVDEVRVGDFYNNNTGFPNIDDLIPLEGLLIPGGSLLRCVVRDAPATNPINIMISLQNVGQRGRRR